VATVTAEKLIKSALRLLEVFQEGEVPSAAVMNDGLDALNCMIDSWNTERLATYATRDQVFTWPSATATRTIGPTGNLVGYRPVQVDTTTYFKDTTSGVSYPIRIINQEQYNGIALKTATSTFPQYMWINYDNPNATMTIWPIPSRALEFHIVSVDELTQPATLTTSLSLPPGYWRAYKSNLALEYCAEFGIIPSAAVVKMAKESKHNIKRINQDDGILSMPASLLAGPGRFNIYIGNY